MIYEKVIESIKYQDFEQFKKLISNIELDCILGLKGHFTLNELPIWHSCFREWMSFENKIKFPELIIKSFADKGQFFDIDTPTTNPHYKGFSAYMLSVDFGDIQRMNWLASMGANPNFTNQRSKNAESIIKSMNIRPQLIEVLLNQLEIDRATYLNQKIQRSIININKHPAKNKII